MLKFPTRVEPDPAPSRLGMDAYADWVAHMLSITDPGHARRQKEFEEQIFTPFRIPEKNSFLRPRHD